jgi:hypothetical protein
MRPYAVYVPSKHFARIYVLVYSYRIGEQARLKGGVPLRRLLRGAVAAYRRFLHTGEPAYRFHCWVTIRTVSAGLD